MTVKPAKIAHPTRLPTTMTAMVSQSPSLRTMPSAPRAQLIGAMFAPAQIHICCSPVESLSASGMGSMLWTSTLSSAPASVVMLAPLASCGCPLASRRQNGVKGGASSRLGARSEEHTSELQSRENLVCRLLLEKKKRNLRHVHNRCTGVTVRPNETID